MGREDRYQYSEAAAGAGAGGRIRFCELATWARVPLCPAPHRTYTPESDSSRHYSPYRVAGGANGIRPCGRGRSNRISGLWGPASAKRAARRRRGEHGWRRNRFSPGACPRPVRRNAAPASPGRARKGLHSASRPAQALCFDQEKNQRCAKQVTESRCVGWRDEEEERTLEVAVEPFGLPGADVARPPPRVGIARRSLQHPPPRLLRHRQDSLKVQQCALPTFAVILQRRTRCAWRRRGR